MSDTIEIIIRAKDETGKGLNAAKSGIAGLGQAFGPLLKVGAGAFLGIGAAAVAGFGVALNAAIKMNASLEQSTMQFTTLMGDADKAAEHVAMLFEMGAKTPFETEPIIQASKHLQVFGGEALNTRANLLLIGDAAAAVGANFDEVAFWVGRAYSAIQGGQPFGEAAMRLQELGLMSPKVRGEMERLQKAGADASEVWGEFAGSLEQFSGAMEMQSESWEGLVSTLKDNLNMLAADVLQPFFEAGKEGMGELIELINDPDIVRGLTNMGKELGKAAAAFLELTGAAVRFFSAMGQRADTNQIIRDLGLSLREVRDLTYEIQDQMGVGLIMTTEEDLAVQTAVNAALREQYANQLLIIEAAKTGRSEWQDWGAVRAETEAAAAAAVMEASLALQDYYEYVNSAGEGTDVAAAHTQEYYTYMGFLRDRAGEAAVALELVTAAEEAAAIQTEIFAEAFQSVIGGFTEELDGADEPFIRLADGMGGAATTATGLAVNVSAVRQAIFDQLQLMPGAEQATVAFGVATGIMSDAQAEAALQAAAVKIKIDELAASIAAGMPVEDALADLDKFIDKIENGVGSAVTAMATDIPAQVVEMKELAAAEALNAGTAIMEGMSQGITDNQDDTVGVMEAAAEDVISGVKKKFEVESPSKVFAEIGADLMLGLQKGGTDMLSATVAVFVGIGRAIVQGAISGVRAMGGALTGALREIVDAAIAAIKAALGIDSPSRVFYEIGVNMVDGLIQAIRDKQPEAAKELDDMFSALSKISGLGGNFSNLFSAQNIAPIEGMIEDVTGQVGSYTTAIQDMMNSLGLGAFNPDTPGVLVALQNILNDPTASFTEQNAANTAIALLEERQQLMLQQIELQRQLEDQQNRLLRLEMQRQQLGFLQQQFELLKLIRDNGLDVGLLDGLTFGADADPGALMDAMIGAMTQMIGQTTNELMSIAPQPRSRSLPAEFFQDAAGGTAGGGGSVVVNIDARGAANGVEQDVRRVVHEVMREYGVRADIRMRTT